jgi:protein SCO1/2
MQKAFPIYLVCVALMSAVTAGAEQETPRIGIEEHLGKRIPLETLSFTGERGEPVRLAELFDRPVALTLVYYRCPSICTPLLQEMAKVADLADMAPGEDYRIVTISFDPRDSSELARTKKANMLATLDRKQVPADGWRFLTGEAEQIRQITEAVGFHYARDKNEVDFVHAATVIFLSPDGEIVRYLNGTRFNPADLEMAVVDASEGRARSFM